MTKPTLFVDEDAAEEAVVLALRRYGVDALTVLDVGRAGMDDVDQLRYATAGGRAIYSLNARHFASLHRQLISRGEKHSGIIVFPRPSGVLVRA